MRQTFPSEKAATTPNLQALSDTHQSQNMEFTAPSFDPRSNPWGDHLQKQSNMLTEPTAQAVKHIQPINIDENVDTRHNAKLPSPSSPVLDRHGQSSFSPWQSHVGGDSSAEAQFDFIVDNNIGIDNESFELANGRNVESRANGNVWTSADGAIDPSLRQMILQPKRDRESPSKSAIPSGKGSLPIKPLNRLASQHDVFDNQNFGTAPGIFPNERFTLPGPQELRMANGVSPNVSSPYSQVHHSPQQGIEMPAGASSINWEPENVDPNIPAWQTYLQRMQTAYFVSTSASHLLSGPKKLRVHRTPHRPYEKSDFEGIRKGGRQFTSPDKVVGNWNQEAQANHYVAWLAYHGRPNYQHDDTSGVSSYLQKSNAVATLNTADKELLQEFIRASKYWKKYQLLPNPPNTVLRRLNEAIGDDEDLNGADIQIDDPNETDGEEDHEPISVKGKGMRRTTAKRKRSRNQQNDDPSEIPASQTAHLVKKARSNLLAINRPIQSPHPSSCLGNRSMGEIVFSDLDTVDKYLQRNHDMTIMGVLNEALASRRLPPMRLIQNDLASMKSVNSHANTRNSVPAPGYGPSIPTSMADYGVDGVVRDPAFAVSSYTPGINGSTAFTVKSRGVSNSAASICNNSSPGKWEANTEAAGEQGSEVNMTAKLAVKTRAGIEGMIQTKNKKSPPPARKSKSRILSQKQMGTQVASGFDRAQLPAISASGTVGQTPVGTQASYSSYHFSDGVTSGGIEYRPIDAESNYLSSHQYATTATSGLNGQTPSESNQDSDSFTYSESNSADQIMSFGSPSAGQTPPLNPLFDEDVAGPLSAIYGELLDDYGPQSASANVNNSAEELAMDPFNRTVPFDTLVGDVLSQFFYPDAFPEMFDGAGRNIGEPDSYSLNSELDTLVGETFDSIWGLPEPEL
ncbi:hypothetical protein N431DRAFT_456156 [Stipitochalara longipes BDJ]|nr:hypothetical protein N431DRAFT_456156 [Stipitochalara longipes BDJ]